MDELESQLKLEEISTTPYEQWDPLIHVYDFDTNVLPNWLQWLTSYAVGAERQKIFSYIINEKLLNRSYARDPKDPIVNETPIIEMEPGDDDNASNSEDSGGMAEIEPVVSSFASFAGSPGTRDKFTKFHSEKGLSKTQFDAFLWELLAYYLENNNSHTINATQLIDPSSPLDIIDDAAGAHAHHLQQMQQMETAQNIDEQNAQHAQQPDDAYNEQENGTGSSSHAKDASLFLLPSEMTLNLNNYDADSPMHGDYTPSPMPFSPDNGAGGVNSVTAIKNNSLSVGKAGTGPDAANSGNSSNSASTPNNGQQELKQGQDDVEFENELSRAKEQIGLNPELYEKIVSKIRDNTMHEKAQRNHERHSSLQKMSDNSKYQILSDIYKLILKSEQFVNGMRNNINRLFNEKYYIPYPISSTEDGIEDEFAQMRSLPLRFSWKFMWNIDNIICGYALLGVDDDEPMDEPYNDANNYASASEYGGPTSTDTGGGSNPNDAMGVDEDDEGDMRVWPYMPPSAAVLPKEVIAKLEKEKLTKERMENERRKTTEINDINELNQMNQMNDQMNGMNKNAPGTGKDPKGAGYLSVGANGQERDGQRKDEETRQRGASSGASSQAHGSELGFDEEAEEYHMRGDTMQLVTVDLDTNETKESEVNGKGKYLHSRTASAAVADMDPVTREAFKKINLIYQNVLTTNDNIINFSAVFDTFKNEVINELANISEYHRKQMESMQARSRPERKLLNDPDGIESDFDTSGMISSHTTMIDFDVSVNAGTGQQDFVSMGGRSRTRTIEEDLEETGNELLRRLTDSEDALRSRTGPQTPVFNNSRAGAHSHNMMLIADEVDRITKEHKDGSNGYDPMRQKSQGLENAQSQYENKIIKLEATITQLRNDVKRNEKSLQEKDRLIQELMQQHSSPKNFEAWKVDLLSNIQNSVLQAIKAEGGHILSANKNRKFGLTESVMSPLPAAAEANEQMDNIEKRQEDIISAIKAVEAQQAQINTSTNAINKQLLSSSAGASININASAGSMSYGNGSGSGGNLDYEREISKLTGMNVSLMDEIRLLKEEIERKDQKMAQLTSECDRFRRDNIGFLEMKSKLEEQVRYLNESKLRTINNMVDEMNQMREKIAILGRKKQ